MKFMIMHKMTPEMEKGLPPDPTIIEGVGRLMTEAGKAGIFLGGEGLKPSSTWTRITYEDGKRIVTDGPFAEAKELVAGFAVFQVKSREEALEWADKAAVAGGGNGDTFIGPVVEMWDLGFAPKPENAPLRYLSMAQATKASEAEIPPDPKLMESVGAYMQEMQNAGVLQAMGGLRATKHGARLHFGNGKRTVIDGPFAESKELIAGYAMCELPSLAAAIEFATKFAEVVKVHEIDIRLMWG